MTEMFAVSFDDITHMWVDKFGRYHLPSTVLRQVVDGTCGYYVDAEPPSTQATTKPSNPKDSVGVKKVPLSPVPAPVLMEIGLAMFEGALKYGRYNYRAVGVRSSVYYDALMRHLTAYWEGEDIDPESGASHLVKAIACLVVWRDAEIQGKLTDDRPPASKAGWQKELNDKAAKLIEKFADPKAAYTEIDNPSGNK